MLENAHFPPKDICFPTAGGPCQYNNTREKKKRNEKYIYCKESSKTWFENDMIMYLENSKNP